VKFYLGLHQPCDVEKVNLPAFVSVSRLLKRKSPLKHSDWIMDSGGFTALSKNGSYAVSEREYIECIERHKPSMAFCQDWMCEDFILKKTRLTIKEHQERTIESYLSLSEMSEVIRPVIQGWDIQDYLDCIRMYKQEGVDMTQLFGLGTVCSRNVAPGVIYNLISVIKDAYPDIKLHGFGVKSTALIACAELLESADSMAWSFNARRTKLCPDCPINTCANCLEFALLWRKKLITQVAIKIKESRG
jgi:hypothetical protein